MLTDSLFQTAATAKERGASEVEVNGWFRRWAEDDWSVLAGCFPSLRSPPPFTARAVLFQSSPLLSYPSHFSFTLLPSFIQFRRSVEDILLCETTAPCVLAGVYLFSYSVCTRTHIPTLIPVMLVKSSRTSWPQGQNFVLGLEELSLASASSMCPWHVLELFTLAS